MFSSTKENQTTKTTKKAPNKQNPKPNHTTV